MFFIPLSQVESVELVIHALRMAGGQADCSNCPAARVCMKQCLAIAEAVQRMVQAGTLPVFGEEPGPVPQTAGPVPEKARLQVVK
jgi:hypothetical protein